MLGPGNAETYNVRALFAALLLGIAIIVISFGAVYSPFVVAGVVLGAALLAIALMAPLALVALMLVIGPIDLSFTTGGFKSLLPALGGLDMNGIRLVGATAGFAAYIMFEPRSREAALGTLGRPWVIFLAFAATTIALSLDRIEGLRLLFKIAYPFLTFLVVMGVAGTRERVSILMKLVLGAAMAYTLIINPILVANGGYQVDFEGNLRVGGLGIGAGPFALYVLPMLLIVFARFMVRLQPHYLLFSLVLMGWIAASGTRVAAVAALIGMAVIGVLAALSTGNRKIMVGALVAAALGGVVLLPNVLARSFGFIPSAGELVQLVRDPLALYNAINWSGRQVLWAVLWGAFLASPIVGLGLGSSTVVLRETLGGGGVRDAHNDYIRLATDTGILGVLLFLIAMCTWMVAALRLSRSGDAKVREYAFAAAALAVGLLTVALADNAIDYYTTMTQYLGFLMAGALIMHSDKQQAAAES